MGVLVVAVGDRNDDGLDRRQPHRESPGVVLYQDAHEPLHRPEQRPVDHVRPVLLPVVPDVSQAEPLWQVEVELDGRDLPLASDGVSDVDVDLGAVECAAALVDLVVDPPVDEGRPQRLRGELPLLGFPDGLVGPGRQHDVVFCEAEAAEKEESQVEYAVYLVHNLVRPAEDVGVVLRHAANAQQALDDAAALVAVHRAQLSDSHGQVPVASNVVLVVHDVEGAVHRLEVVLLAVHLDRGVHVLAVEAQMPARLPQRRAPDVWRVDEVVAPGVVLALPEVLDQAAHPRPFRVPYDEAGPRLVVDGEEVQVPAQDAVVAAPGFLQPVEVLVERLLGLEGRPVDALQRLAVLVAPPVCARHAQELECGNPARRVDVGPRAEVLECAVLVRRDRLALWDLVDYLQLQGLVGVHVERLVLRVLMQLERMVLGDGFAHRFFNGAEVVVGEGIARQEVVVEAVVRRGADRQPRTRVHARHHVGHDVGRGVPDAFSELCYVLIYDHSDTSCWGLVAALRKEASRTRSRVKRRRLRSQAIIG